MRRRSERKKSVDVSSPAPASRRTSRRSQKVSESVEEKEENVVGELGKSVMVQEVTEVENNVVTTSSEDCSEPVRKERTRNRTPVKERSSPAKRRNRRVSSDHQKIDAIPEEKNGNEVEDVETSNKAEVELKDDTQIATTENASTDKKEEEEDVQQTVTEVTATSPSLNEKMNVEDNLKQLDVLEIQVEEQEQEKEHDDEETSQSQNEATSEKVSEELKSNEEEKVDNVDIPDTKEETSPKQQSERSSRSPSKETEKNEPANDTKDTSPLEVAVSEQKNRDKNTTANSTDNGRTRKRKWITKKTVESKAPILSISTDSLKNLISDVHPVPLSDVQLESSSEVEVLSEREEGEETPSPERELRRSSTEKNEKSKRYQNDQVSVSVRQPVKEFSPMQRSPSPPKNNASCVLFITNLVRPFTVLQLKGLLARTGKIVEDGFWIDRIKSKCYVQYETEDEAIETRHALHGVRWPVSNPKCLNVDFGSRADMERAIQSTKDDAPRFGQENNKDNFIVGTGWNRERNDFDDKKSSRPVREWDVGKKESLERDKGREDERRRSKDRENMGNRENERNDRDRERKNRSKAREQRSSSLSPVRKVKKKENDPPLRLLDDLFRKTKATPCIYWLPLTPEQIAEKEAFRQKRIEEQKQRIKQRELERGKEREKERERERNRASERTRDRDREHRRNRSVDRRSRSRDRRRY